MKEYIKLFNNLQSADGYVINDIPFTTTVSGSTVQNLRCNEENKKLEVEGGTVIIVDASAPNDEIWYTSSDGNIIIPTYTSSFPDIVSNTYADGKGVIKFKTDVTNIGSYAFSNCRSLTSVIIPDSVTSIEYDAFQCGGYRYTGSLQTITVGETIFTFTYGWGTYFTITLGNGTSVELEMFIGAG